MFKTKGAMLGLAVALVGSALLLAGLAMGSTAGAATDASGGPSGFPADTATNPGNPPASPVEPIPSDPTAGKLPGARPRIDASQYPSLQAAIDALPAEGGIVNLPPGTFELSEPLVITPRRVRLSGGIGFSITTRCVLY